MVGVEAAVDNANQCVAARNLPCSVNVQRVATVLAARVGSIVVVIFDREALEPRGREIPLWRFGSGTHANIRKKGGYRRLEVCLRRVANNYVALKLRPFQLRIGVDVVQKVARCANGQQIRC